MSTPSPIIVTGTQRCENIALRSRLRAHAQVVARIGASVTLLGVVLWWIEWSAMVDVLRGASISLLLIVLAFFFVERILSAYRWHVLIQTQTQRVGYFTTLKVTFLSTFLGSFLPGGVGHEAVRIAGLTRTTSDLAGALSTVAVDRVLGFLALVAILMFVLPFAPGDAAMAIMVVSAAAILSIGLAFVLLPRIAHGSGRLWIMPPAASEFFRSRLLKVVGSMRAMKRWPRTLVWATALAIVFQFIRIIVSWLIAIALGLDIPILYFLLYVPIIVFLTLLPFTLGGLGVREAAFIFFFGAALTTPEAAFAMSIITYFFALLSCLPGAAVLATGLKKRSDDGP